jgi:hypothetical protein
MNNAKQRAIANATTTKDSSSVLRFPIAIGVK